MNLYFAYGSNLHHAQMKRRCPKCQYIKKYTLKNYQLTFRSKYGAADIEKRIGKNVYGALYLISKCADCSTACTPASVLPDPITVIFSFKYLLIVFCKTSWM